MTTTDNRLLRLLRHRWSDADDARRALGPDAVERLAERVRQSELHHSGEIRICVEAGLPLSYLWRDAHPHERALTLFGKLRVWDTECNNGVLVYLLLVEHHVEIVADRGLAACIPKGYWDSLVGDMVKSFREGRFEEGLAAAVDAVGAVLTAHFPLATGARNPNELPDAPVIV